MKRYKDLQLALPKAAKGHKIQGYQEVADETTLELVKKNLSSNVPLTLDHEDSVAGKAFAGVGYLDKDSVRIVGNQLVGDLVIPDESYSKERMFIGEYIDSEIESNPNSMKLSFEFPNKDLLHDIDPVTKEAKMRPGSVSGISFVKDPAITDRLFAFKKLAAARINTITKEDKIMTEEIKNDNVIPVDASDKPETVGKVAALAKKLAAGDYSVNIVSGSITDEGAGTNSSQKPEMSEHEKAIHEKLDAIIAALGTQKDSIEALKQNSVNSKSGKITTDLSAKKEEAVPVVKYSADIEVPQKKEEKNIATFSDNKRTLNVEDAASRNARLFFGKV